MCKNNGCKYDNGADTCGEIVVTDPPAPVCADYDGKKTMCKNNGCQYNNQQETCGDVPTIVCSDMDAMKTQCKNNLDVCAWDNANGLCLDKPDTACDTLAKDDCKASSHCVWAEDSSSRLRRMLAKTCLDKN